MWTLEKPYTWTIGGPYGDLKWTLRGPYTWNLIWILCGLYKWSLCGPYTWTLSGPYVLMWTLSGTLIITEIIYYKGDTEYNREGNIIL